MATYNGALHVVEQLESIVSQTLLPHEILVFDDLSTDKTVSLIRQYARRVSVPIVVRVNEKRLGYADNFLQAIALAGGNYIAFSDQDDYWYPQKLELQHLALQRYEADLCAHAVRAMDKDGNPLSVIYQAQANTAVRDTFEGDPWGNYYGFTILVRTELLRRMDPALRGEDSFGSRDSLSHDRWAYTLAWSLGRMVVIPDVLAMYRQHGAQAFGGPGNRGLREKIANKHYQGESQLPRLAQISLVRSGRFDQYPLAGRAWLSEYRALTARSAVYAFSSPMRRLSAFARAVRHGAYSQLRSSGLRSRRIADDLLFGVFRLMRRQSGRGQS